MSSNAQLLPLPMNEVFDSVICFFPDWHGRPVHENPAGYSQKSVVLGHENEKKEFIWNTNNMVLQMISREDNFDFHHWTGTAC
jgi:hypothetical protein